MVDNRSVLLGSFNRSLTSLAAIYQRVAKKGVVASHRVELILSRHGSECIYKALPKRIIEILSDIIKTEDYIYKILVVMSDDVDSDEYKKIVSTYKISTIDTKFTDNVKECLSIAKKESKDSESYITKMIMDIMKLGGSETLTSRDITNITKLLQTICSSYSELMMIDKK